LGKTSSQVSVSTTAKLILAANPACTFYELVNTTSGVTVFLGPTNQVTASTGHALLPGVPMPRRWKHGDDTQTAVYGITASGTAVVTVDSHVT
jgi:hypothetical protein